VDVQPNAVPVANLDGAASFHRFFIAMDRRGFLQRAMAVAASLAVDPEQLLWRPEAKTIFIPKVVSVAQYSHDVQLQLFINGQWKNVGTHVSFVNGSYTWQLPSLDGPTQVIIGSISYKS